MDAKLTLKLDKNVIEKAKEYAASRNRSLSRIIEAYLKALTIQENQSEKQTIEISPYVKSISSGVNIPTDINYKKEYSNYLAEKYK